MAKYKPTHDNAKAEMDQDNGNSRYHFAQYEVFFQDAEGRIYVGLRWCDQSGPGIILDDTVLLPRFKLRPHDQPRSYSALPASCIHNSALYHCAIMPPRELRKYMSFNGEAV
jgi:hypothetical protein